MCECREHVSIDHVGARKVDHHIGVQTIESRREIRLHEDAIFRHARELTRIRAACDVNCTDEFQFRIVDHSLQHRASHTTCSTIYQNLCQGNLLPNTV